MNSETAINVENISKRYRVGVKVESPDSLVGAMTNLIAAPFNNFTRISRLTRFRATDEPAEVIWAVNDVSFEIRSGEVVGLIGRNGAGKSTLLKILSKITDPTSGQATVRGRVRTLLEVGTGFHAELTGRENIYVNGAILGMKRVEIDKKFDEIVDFSGIERYIDTPVKRYSSGMGVRLAFAVAAHLEPDVMLIDEVLAVGDAQFQKKCLGKIETVGREGRTVIFVSHNMQYVSRLCDRIILLDQGKLIDDGPAQRVIGKYLLSDESTHAVRRWPNVREAPGNEVVRLRGVYVRSEMGQISESVDIRQPVSVELEYDVLEGGMTIVPSIRLINDQGIAVFDSLDITEETNKVPRDQGTYRSTMHIPGNFLAEGLHTARVGLSTLHPRQKHVVEPDAVAFNVYDPAEGDSARGDFGGDVFGVVRPKLKWATVYESPESAP